MGLLDWFRRPPPIADRGAVVDFLDQRAAFLSQKSIFDYVRGRSGPYFSMIIKEESFKAGVEKARWQNYPYGLSIVAEMIYGVLLEPIGDRTGLARIMREIALEAFDRYPVPAALGEEVWSSARKDLSSRVDAVSLHPPKFVKDIPLPFAQVFFDNMPIHERLREQDFELIRDQVRVNLISMHRDFLKVADLSALTADLKTGKPAIA